MLISISKKHRKHGKAKSKESTNRSQFLSMLFGLISGDYGNQLMEHYCTGNPKFKEEWEQVSKKVLQSLKG
jgi:hypothetical protein